jgi:hypothetical protein
MPKCLVRSPAGAVLRVAPKLSAFSDSVFAARSCLEIRSRGRLVLLAAQLPIPMLKRSDFRIGPLLTAVPVD